LAKDVEAACVTNGIELPAECRLPEMTLKIQRASLAIEVDERSSGGH
jgi:hypothetical protein